MTTLVGDPDVVGGDDDHLHDFIGVGADEGGDADLVAGSEQLEVAAVQGGGEQGTSALEVPSSLVTDRHLDATRSIPDDADLDLVLWPENTIDVSVFDGSDVYLAIAAEAARLDATFAVGVTEDPWLKIDRDKIRNAEFFVRQRVKDFAQF